MPEIFIDRAGWPSGPWNNEPDREQWTDATTGFDCLIRRGPSGALCGYVAVGPDHPWFEMHYGDCTLPEPCEESYCEHTADGGVDVHGGITYTNECDGDVDQGICHRTHDEDVAWWFGFDCCHYMDVRPDHIAKGWGAEGSYRTWGYVRAQVEQLAVQLAEVSHAE